MSAHHHVHGHCISVGVLFIYYYFFFLSKDAVAFWMEKGIDGYRLDAVYHSFEVPSLEDEPENPDYVKPINQTQVYRSDANGGAWDVGI